MLVSCVTPTIRGFSGLQRPALGLLMQTFKDYEWVYEIHDPKDPPDLNACLNRLIKRSKGDIIVFLQDYILPNPTGLQQFVDAMNHQEAFYTAPVGKTLDDKEVEWEWRKYRSMQDDLNSMEWEIDWACASRNSLVKIGGFDEELDKYWGFDNVNIGLRAEMAGYKIRNLPANTAVAFDHNKKMEHPYMGLRNPDFHNARLKEIEMGTATISFL